MSKDARRTAGVLLITAGIVGLILLPYLMFVAWNRGVATMDEAVKIAEDFLKSLNNEDLAIDEIMEYRYNFYVVYYEKSTGMGAFEMLIDKAGNGGMMGMWAGSIIRPEPGPNMMWNTKYGAMGSGMMVWSSEDNQITEEKAKQYAQRYLDNFIPGAKAEDVHKFYGYYTIHVDKGGRNYGMLSVNAYTGDVWFHDWHGEYVQTREMKVD
jgi:hypothetical protein